MTITRSGKVLNENCAGSSKLSNIKKPDHGCSGIASVLRPRPKSKGTKNNKQRFKKLKTITWETVDQANLGRFNQEAVTNFAATEGPTSRKSLRLANMTQLSAPNEMSKHVAQNNCTTQPGKSVEIKKGRAPSSSPNSRKRSALPVFSRQKDMRKKEETSTSKDREKQGNEDAAGKDGSSRRKRRLDAKSYVKAYEQMTGIKKSAVLATQEPGHLKLQEAGHSTADYSHQVEVHVVQIDEDKSVSLLHRDSVKAGHCTTDYSCMVDVDSVCINGDDNVPLLHKDSGKAVDANSSENVNNACSVEKNSFPDNKYSSKLHKENSYPRNSDLPKRVGQDVSCPSEEDVSPAVHDLIFRDEQENACPENADPLQKVPQRNVCFCSREQEENNSPTKCILGNHGDLMIPEEHLAASILTYSTDDALKFCDACKQTGTLLSCNARGCKRSYHLSCLDIPSESVPPASWLCNFCIVKKMQVGVYAVAMGLESLWDVKELNVPGEDHIMKQYLVKYKNFAHVHNRWLSELEVLEEAPELLLQFNRDQEEKTTVWRKEWIEPQRLLKKRLFILPKQQELLPRTPGYAFLCCKFEWLVKWRDLGYEDATWELDTSPFLCTDGAKSLIEDYENRCIRARKACDPSNKVFKQKESPFCKILNLPDEVPIELDNDHLISINQLRDFWHKGRHAVFIDDQEKVLKIVLFILSLASHVCRPFLVVSWGPSLSSWVAMFNRLSQSINVVVYDGSKDVRKLIQNYEFYDDGGCLLFQVLISHPDAIFEDFQVLDCIVWEAIIIDDVQNCSMSKSLEQFKNLSTDMRLLLLSNPLQDNLVEFISVLSFIEPEGSSHYYHFSDVKPSDVGTLAILKKKLARHIAYERKLGTSKFVEYWVPVCLSVVQLKLYCDTLHANSSALRSFSRTDHVDALRDLLISLRECCDHPYLVDKSLESSLTKDHPGSKILDIGVSASGKLLLLDKILQVMHHRGLRALILFQSVGGAGNPIGDILDDFLCQRFGPDSYERVERGYLMSKKLAAMNAFNDKTSGRFVFLIENRACLPSIKLMSVDAVIIYNSDWNLQNDVRSIQKMHIESQSENINIFRLYSSWTVEEKVLMLAKQDLLLDSNIRNITSTLSHSLLSWGAANLFEWLQRLDQDIPTSNGSNLKEVMEVLTSDKADISRSIITEASLSGTSYSRKIILACEKEKISSLDGDPPKFWSTLFDGRCRLQNSIPERSKRCCRKVQSADSSVGFPLDQNNDIRRKRQKVTGEINTKTIEHEKSEGSPRDKNDHVRQESVPFFCEIKGKTNEDSSNKAGILPPSEQIPFSEKETEKYQVQSREFTGVAKLLNLQKSLYLSLKPELSKLCDVLGFQGDVRCLTEDFLDYILKNHRVGDESKAILQAFILSLCCRAASVLKCKIDRRESLELARKYLKYECDEEMVEGVYHKLKILRKSFLCQEIISGKQKNSDSVPDEQPTDDPNCTNKILRDVNHPSASNVAISTVNPMPETAECPVAESGKELHHDIVERREGMTAKFQPLAAEVHEISAERLQKGPFESHQVLLTDTLQDIRSLESEHCKRRSILNPPASIVVINCMNPMSETVEHPVVGSSKQLHQDIAESEEGMMANFLLTTEVHHEISAEGQQSCPYESHQELLTVAHQDIGSLESELFKRKANLIEGVCSVREKEMILMQQDEIAEFKRCKEKEKMKLKRQHCLHLGRICMIHTDPRIRSEKMKSINLEFIALLHKFEQQMKCELDKLESLHSVAKFEEHQLKGIWLEKAKHGTLDGSFDEIPVLKSVFIVQEFKNEKDHSESHVLRKDTYEVRPLLQNPVEHLTSEVPAHCVSTNSGGFLGYMAHSHTEYNVSQKDAYKALMQNSVEKLTSEIPARCVFPNSRDSCGHTAHSSSIEGEVEQLINLDIAEDETTIAAVRIETPVVADDSEASTNLFIGEDGVNDVSGHTDTTLSSSQMDVNDPSVPKVSNLRTADGAPERLDSLAGQHELSGATEDLPVFVSQDKLVLISPPSGVSGTNTSNNIMGSLDHLKGMLSVFQQQANSAFHESEAQPDSSMHCSAQVTPQLLPPSQEPITTTVTTLNPSGELLSQLRVLENNLTNCSIEATRSYEGITGVSAPESGYGPPHLLEMVSPILASQMHHEPLRNELLKIRQHKELVKKKHEDKKAQLNLELEHEMDKIRKKYDVLLKNEDAAFIQVKHSLDDIYNKVLVNQYLAEGFKTNFNQNTSHGENPIVVPRNHTRPLVGSLLSGTATVQVGKDLRSPAPHLHRFNSQVSAARATNQRQTTGNFHAIVLDKFMGSHLSAVSRPQSVAPTIELQTTAACSQTMNNKMHPPPPTANGMFQSTMAQVSSNVLQSLRGYPVFPLQPITETSTSVDSVPTSNVQVASLDAWPLPSVGYQENNSNLVTGTESAENIVCLSDGD